MQLKCSIIVCHAKTNDVRVGIQHVFIYSDVSLFLQIDLMKSIFLFFFKGQVFSLQLNSYLSLFHPFITIYVYSPNEVGDFTYFLK